MEKKKWYQVDLTGNRGSTTITKTFSKLANSKGEASKLAKDSYKKMFPEAKNVSIKKNKPW